MYRIVLADYEKAILSLMEKLIESLSGPYEICARVSNGVEALQAVWEFQPEILIADVRMPGLNGIELLREIRQSGEKTAVIMVSGYSDFEYVQKSLRLGAVDYLLKPINREELRECLEKIEQKYKDATAEEENLKSIHRELDRKSVV